MATRLWPLPSHPGLETDHLARNYAHQRFLVEEFAKLDQKATEFHRDGETLRSWHLPIFERPVYLHLHTQRSRCPKCDARPSTTRHGNWYDIEAHGTKAFANYLLREIVGSTLSDVACEHNETNLE